MTIFDLVIGAVLPATQPVDIFAPMRVDCNVSATRTFFDRNQKRQTEPSGSSTYIFLIPYEAAVGREAYYLVTADDGRSWLSDIKISHLVGGNWPSFSAVLGEVPETIRLQSDPTIRGQVSFSSFPTMLTDGAGVIEKKGICKLTIKAEPK